jgi:hypothetical protein
MRSLTATILFFWFVSIAVFGVFGFTFFDHVMVDGSKSGCIVSAIDGATCPTSIMGMTLHHVSALQSLTTTLPSSSGRILLLVSLFLVSASLFLFNRTLLLPPSGLLPRRRVQDLTLHWLYRRQKIASWLSLFEYSPAKH